MYKGMVIRSESFDPNYKVKFSYTTDKYTIVNAEATFARISPVPIVLFSDYTDYLMEKNEVDAEIVKTIKLEIGQTVFDFIVGMTR